MTSSAKKKEKEKEKREKSICLTASTDHVTLHFTYTSCIHLHAAAINKKCWNHGAGIGDGTTVHQMHTIYWTASE